MRCEIELTYALRYAKAQWGVFIDLTAQAVTLNNASHQGVVSVTESLYVLYDLKKPPKLCAVEQAYIESGLQHVAEKIANSHKLTPPIVVQVTGMRTNDCDYQEEGFMLAIIGWASHYFDFEMPTIEGSFDRAKNRYTFWIDGQLL